MLAYIPNGLLAESPPWACVRGSSVRPCGPQQRQALSAIVNRLVDVLKLQLSEKHTKIIALKVSVEYRSCPRYRTTRRRIFEVERERVMHGRSITELSRPPAWRN